MGTVDPSGSQALTREAVARLAPPAPGTAYHVPDTLEYLSGRLPSAREAGLPGSVTSEMLSAYGRQAASVVASVPRYEMPIGMEVPGLGQGSYGLPKAADAGPTQPLGYEAQRFASYFRN